MRRTRRISWSVVVLAALAVLLGAPGCKPGWSSDGTSVAFWYAPKEDGPSFLATCDITTGAVKRVFVSRQHELLRPAYAPDDQSLFVLAARESGAKGSQNLCDMDVLRVRLDPKSKEPTQAYEKLATIKAIQGEPLMDYDLIVDGQGQLWWTWYEKPDKKAGRSERHLPLRIDPATGTVSRPFKDRNVRLLRGPAGIFGVEGIWKDKRVGILRLAKEGPTLEYLAGAAGTLGKDRLLAVGKRHLAASREIPLQKTKGVRLELRITELTGKLAARIEVPEQVKMISAAAFAADDRTLWAFSAGGAWLLRFDLEKGIFVGALTIPRADRPDALSPSPSGTHFAGSFSEPTADGSILRVFDLTGKKPQIKRMKLPR